MHWVFCLILSRVLVYGCVLLTWKYTEVMWCRYGASVFNKAAFVWLRLWCIFRHSYLLIYLLTYWLGTDSVGILLQGNPDPLNSAFHLTYNMVLNLLRVEEINPEYMLERSFYQFQNYASIPALIDSKSSSSFCFYVLCAHHYHHHHCCHHYWIGFCHTGPISLCVDLFVFICVYFVCFVSYCICVVLL